MYVMYVLSRVTGLDLTTDVQVDGPPVPPAGRTPSQSSAVTVSQLYFTTVYLMVCDVATM
jgi:hypothetical protein